MCLRVRDCLLTYILYTQGYWQLACIHSYVYYTLVMKLIDDRQKCSKVAFEMKNRICRKQYDNSLIEKRSTFSLYLTCWDEWGDGPKQLNNIYWTYEMNNESFSVEKICIFYNTCNQTHVISKEKNTFTNNKDYQINTMNRKIESIINHSLRVFTEAL